ncbi:hypothetical protein FGRA07_03526 [Fusarium graminearum]|nr:hypothetical protein FGRA07_03526 [Fusarium graminearum]
MIFLYFLLSFFLFGSSKGDHLATSADDTEPDEPLFLDIPIADIANAAEDLKLVEPWTSRYVAAIHEKRFGDALWARYHIFGEIINGTFEDTNVTVLDRIEEDAMEYKVNEPELFSHALSFYANTSSNDTHTEILDLLANVNLKDVTSHLEERATFGKDTAHDHAAIINSEPRDGRLKTAVIARSVSYTYKFVRAAKDAKTDVSALADEINNLGSVLRVLEALASDMEAEGDQFDPTLRNHYLNHCFKALSRIEMKTKKAIERFVRSKVDYLNAQKQQVLNYFMKADPQDNLATSIKLRHSMTGLWLTESTDFVRWIETPGSKLWLTGIPGAGKTVLAGSVIQEALSRSYANHSIAVAFFFCDYKDPKTWETVNILGAIANQLTRQGKEAFEILSLYYDDLHPPDQFITIPDQDEVRARISQMSHLFDQTIIIIDGLDECGDHTDDVVDTLMQMTEDSENTSLAVFSRDHYNIRVHLETDFDIIPIIARTDDIQLYVGAELDRRIRTKRLQLSTLHMREEIHQVLVSRAEGMQV